MKRKDIKDLHLKTIEELQTLVNEMKADVSQMRLDHAMRKLSGTRSIFNKRKDIARILSIMKEKEDLNANH